jgi:hypothetical protein
MRVQFFLDFKFVSNLVKNTENARNLDMLFYFLHNRNRKLAKVWQFIGTWLVYYLSVRFLD